MFKQPIYLLLALSILGGLGACIKEVEFFSTPPSRDQIVITGTFTNGKGTHIVRLTKPGDYNITQNLGIDDAIITLSDDLGNVWEYKPAYNSNAEFSHYILKDVSGEIGRKYTLTVVTSDGRTFTTTPQQMLEPIPCDSITCTGEQDQYVTATGVVVKEPTVKVFAHTKVPQGTGGRYLNWLTESTYIFIEILKIYNPINPYDQKSCFVTVPLSGQIVAIANPYDLQASSSFSTLIARKKFDFTFENRLCFSSYQYTIDQSAYKYWEKVEKLIAQNGTIFDAPPAPIPGNLINANDPNDVALGYFQVASADTARVYVENGSFGPVFTLADNSYCDYDWSKWPPVNHPECDECTLLPNSTLEKPWWWK